jgi:hypothetical protein
MNAFIDMHDVVTSQHMEVEMGHDFEEEGEYASRSINQ